MKVYTKQQVYEETIKYFNGDELPTNVWIDKYCLKNKEGQYLELSPDDMHKRLSKEFARIEQKYPNPLSEDEIYNLLNNFTYIIPGGSLLYGIGNNFSLSSLGNCFVIGNTSDSYAGICTIDQEQVQLMKRRAGVGHDISHLRPKGTPTTNSAKTSSGIIPFMERYSNSTREVAQDGRRGALMLSCNIDHLQAEDFITAKEDLTKVTGANISVKVSDEFMSWVDSKEDLSYDPILEGFVKKDKQLWNKIIHQAWKSAEPGILFWDTIKKESIPSCYGKDWEETSTNPCGEIPLCPYDSCRLMSVNLYSFVDNPFTDKAKFNYEKFKDVVYKAQRLMDDVIDLEEEKINKILDKIENDPEPEEIKAIEKNLWLKIKTKLLEGRRTGLSFIGLGDTFAALNMQYGSDKSIEFASKVSKQFAISAYKSSIDMAKERGAFPIWDYKKEDGNPFLFRLYEYIQWKNYGRRNIALLTIPPSGTISILGKISSGIEPVYQLSYKRRRKVDTNHPNKSFQDQNGDWWEEYLVLHPKFNEWFKIKNNETFKELIVFGNTKFPLNTPYDNSSAYEIDPLQRVKLQAIIQKWIDHSISSTINLKKDTTEEEVSNLYMEAWKQGCKGLTIYVDECRTGVLVSNETKQEEFKQHDAPKRPKELECNIYSTTVKGKKFYVLVGLLNSKPYEVFAINKDLHYFAKDKGTITKFGKGIYTVTEKDEELGWKISEELTDEEATITRLVSTSLRHGADIKFIVEQLNKTKGDLTQYGKAIARVLKLYIKDNEQSTNTCPECGSKLIYKDGCESCTCGYSKCG